MVTRKMNFEERTRQVIGDAILGECEICICVSDDEFYTVSEGEHVKGYDDCIEIFKKEGTASVIIPYDKIICVKWLHSSLAEEKVKEAKEKMEAIKTALDNLSGCVKL